jgi:hypothetical protein
VSPFSAFFLVGMTHPTQHRALGAMCVACSSSAIPDDAEDVDEVEFTGLHDVRRETDVEEEQLHFTRSGKSRPEVAAFAAICSECSPRRPRR